MKNGRALTFGAVAVIGLMGCATAPKAIGTLTLVEKSGSKPDWINTVPDDDGDETFWVGRKSDSDTEDSAVTDAREDCGRQVADYLENTANKVYEKARVELAATEDLGSARPLVRDAYTSWYEKVKATGLKTRKVYWERYEKVVAEGRVRYLYKAYVLMPLSKKQLLAMGKESIQEQLQKAREQNDAMAEKALDRMKEKLALLKR